MAQFLNDVR